MNHTAKLTEKSLHYVSFSPELSGPQISSSLINSYMTSSTTAISSASNRMTPPSSDPNKTPQEGDRVNLLKLATAALASSIVASRPIRKLAVEGRGLSIPGEEGLEGRRPLKKQYSRLKLDGTVITDADGSSQRIIIGALRDVSRRIRIVGEESFDEMERSRHRDDIDAAAAKKQDFESERLKRISENEEAEQIFQMAKKEIEKRYASAWKTPSDHIDSGDVSAGGCQNSEEQPNSKVGRLDERNIDASRVCVFVDPLDGTGCYAKGDYESVTTLIAIMVDNVPCFGVICKPFGEEDEPAILNSGCYAVYGGTLLNGAYVAGGDECERSILYRESNTKVKTEVVECPESPENVPTEPTPRRQARAVISRSRAGGVVRKCIDALADRKLLHREPIHVSGAGYKTLRLITGTDGESLWFFPKAGTSLWDVAAADAILRAIGGRLSDKDGKELDYSKSRLNAENTSGIVACNDAWLQRECIRLFQEEKWDDN